MKATRKHTQFLLENLKGGVTSDTVTDMGRQCIKMYPTEARLEGMDYNLRLRMGNQCRDLAKKVSGQEIAGFFPEHMREYLFLKNPVLRS
jgi:hypothetical protein